MKDHPGISVKKKRMLPSLLQPIFCAKECDALVSSGSTGAAVASALFGLGRIKGIERPAIATVIPSLTGATVLLDSGCQGGRKTGRSLSKVPSWDRFSRIPASIKTRGRT